MKLLLLALLAMCVIGAIANGPFCDGTGLCRGSTRLSRDTAMVLFVDHQSGLANLVQDYGPEVFLNNVLGLAETAKLFELPVVLTTSFENGPNGPIWPELQEMFPDAPFIPRPGQINAWDNEDFVKAVKATGRKQLIIAGILTEVCVAFPTISALNEGFEVFVVTDASGTFNKATREAALMRMVNAGAQTMNWMAVASELQRDWRNDSEGLANLLAKRVPSYKHLINSFKRAQADA